MNQIIFDCIRKFRAVRRIILRRVPLRASDLDQFVELLRQEACTTVRVEGFYNSRRSPGPFLRFRTRTWDGREVLLETPRFFNGHSVGLIDRAEELLDYIKVRSKLQHLGIETRNMNA